MDRREALDSARSGGRRTHREMNFGGRRRRSRHEPQRTAREGDGRRIDRTLSEWRTHPPIKWLSDPTSLARIRRQHARKVAAADQGNRGPTMTKDETSKYTMLL